MLRLPTFFATLALVILFSLPSQAASPIRVGEKNFERGWNRLMHNKRDDAVKQFSSGADGFAEALAADPRSRSTNFPSNLTKAGMTFYFTGRYDESIKIMSEVYEEKTQLWESALFTGLAYAFKDDQDMATQWLNKYLKLLPSQAYLSNIIKNQLEELAKGTTTLRAAADTMDKATVEQFKRNVNNRGNTGLFGNDKCSGSYWWRYNFRPCERKHVFEGS